MIITPVVRKIALESKSPVLIMDLNYVRENYYGMKNNIKRSEIFYAVKANSNNRVINILNNLGSNFDVASKGEIDKLLALGISAERMSFGNTIKKIEDIHYAYANGIKYYAVDSEMEVEKIAAHAPGTMVYGRISTRGNDSDWPLTKKFGTDVNHVKSIMKYADQLGLDAFGVSFHVGSQNYNPLNWEIAIKDASVVIEELRKEGINLRMVNIGGGMPVEHIKPIPSTDEFSNVINNSIDKYLSTVDDLRIFVEPGRSMVGNAGILVAKVILRSTKGEEEWVYIDAGVFHGLAETLEDFRYEIIVEGKENETVKNFKLAGPTCDSVDTIYDKIMLPKTIGYGDTVYFKNAGAYTTEYNTFFNGIEGPCTVFVKDYALIEDSFHELGDY
ncbi:MAG: type III PLP-dependent enzyme [Kosmotoga sp.]|nr:MAG: type III PLP-dependent enzyme [Kosmotoga sp.]